MSWFKKLTGVDEKSPDQVRRELSLAGDCIVSQTGKQIAFGRLQTPQLSELRRGVAELATERRPSNFREIVAVVGELHADPAFDDAVASAADTNGPCCRAV